MIITDYLKSLIDHKFKNFNIIRIDFILILGLLIMSCSKADDSSTTTNPPENPTFNSINYTISVPTEGNSWVVDNPTASGNIIGIGGVSNWTDVSNKIRTYFYADKTGEIEVGLQAKFYGATTLKITVNGSSKSVAFEKTESFSKHNVGKFTISNIGYQCVEMEGVSKNTGSFGDISNVLLGESAWASGINFIKPEWFYWGRRGPSVHLRYNVPSGKSIKWFYNEVTVPHENDVIGSYYMANGFNDGYFGMQVNSETERRILFSIWSAYDTQDPNQIPDEYKVQPLGHGSNVTVGQFGNEGSGAQSYMIYNWKAGSTYKFLLKGESLESNSIDYTAYFYAPEIGDWQLIASFRKPYSNNSNITGLHSFLENFTTTSGNMERQVGFNNQWTYDTQGNWTEITSAKFTIDATGRNGVRLDYDGGIKEGGNGFYLRNCGFFSDSETVDTTHSRTALGVTPNIDFSQLEVPSIPTPAVVTLLDRANWSITGQSSQEDKGGEGNTGRALDVLDGDLNTYWHSCWQDCTANYPHYITIDAGSNVSADGIRLYQRQSLSRSVKDIEIQISTDNSNWESLGDFILQNNASAQDINFFESKTFRYLKIIMKSAHDGQSFAAMAELQAFVKE